MKTARSILVSFLIAMAGMMTISTPAHADQGQHKGYIYCKHAHKVCWRECNYHGVCWRHCEHRCDKWRHY